MAASASSQDYNLTAKMIPFLDNHLRFPLLEADKSDESIRAQYEVLKMTNMPDVLGKLEMKLKGLSKPNDYQQRREALQKQEDDYSELTEKVSNLLKDPDVLPNLRSDRVANMNYLKNEHGVTDQMVETLYDFGRFEYDCGVYEDAADLLHEYRVLSTDEKKRDSATWGYLACQILLQQWESAQAEIQKLKESIDDQLFANQKRQLDARAYLVHWCLFPLFRSTDAKDTLIELFFSVPYINTIQTICPWILRYLIVAVITSRKGSKTNIHQKYMKDLIRVIRQESYQYSDPLTEFVAALYINFDFEEAQKQLSIAEEIFKEDYFLSSALDDFMDAARHLISEVYCKIYQRIDIRDLSSRLGLSEDEGEKWIVNLIRETRVDAKIDYQAGTVEMNHPPQSVYQQVIERTKGGFFRTQVLSAAVAK